MKYGSEGQTILFSRTSFYSFLQIRRNRGRVKIAADFVVFHLAKHHGFVKIFHRNFLPPKSLTAI